MSDSPEETEHYLRFISMYIDLCTEVVYRVFLHAIPNKDTVSFFQSNCKLFHDLEKRKVLSKAEIAFVVSSSPRPEQFDLSLLIKILCNSRTTLTTPLNGWDCQPGPSDLSIAADLLRLRKIRNTIIGHRPQAKLPKYKFDRLWEDVKGILLRLANATDPNSEEGLRKKIEQYRNRPLQTQDEKTTFYLGKLQEWWQTCEEVSKLQNKAEDLVQKIQEISLYFKTKPQDYCLYIRLLFDGGRSVLSGILKKELSSRGLDLKTLLLEQASQLETNFINEEMRKEVFPHLNNPNTDYDSWDMLTLTIVLLNIFGDNLSEEVVEEIKIIEDAVKSYAQTAIESLDMTKFKSCCEDLVSSLKALSNYVGGETKTNFKMHFQAYRSTDDEIDVDNYLNQMALYASEIKSIPGIYNKTIADLKESVNQMKEEGVVFEREKDMDLKMVVIGRNKEKETLAEEILETVWQSALEMSSSTEFSSVRAEVDKILEEVRKIPSANITTVSRHCIILTIRYSSWETLLEILKYVESRTLCEHFENISRELGYICGETVELSGILTVESVHRAMIKLDKHKPRKDSSLNVAISCSSKESMEKVVTMLNSDETRQIFSNIDHALSKCVGDRINVRASPDVKGFCHLLDKQEIPFIDRSGQIASGLQSTEENDQEQMGKLSTDLSYQTASMSDYPEQSGKLPTALSYQTRSMTDFPGKPSTDLSNQTASKTEYPEQPGKPSTDLSNQTASKTEYPRQSGHNITQTKGKRRGMTDSPEETEYYLRFISMYIDLCTEVVYRVFVHAIPNKDTASFFQSNRKLFHDLEKRKVLSKAEIPFVVSSSPRPEIFDLSLLIKILCNSKTTLTPPSNGWDCQPGPSDLSIAADLIRLRKIRNITVEHRNRAKLPKYKFDRLWEGVEGILLRLANATDPSSKEGLRKKIEHYRKRPLQIQDEKTTFYLDKLKEWWQTCEEVSGLQNKVEDLLQRAQEIALYFKTKPQNYCRYIRLLFDGGRSVLSGILKKELCSTGLELQAVLLEKARQLETHFINKEMHSQVFPQQTNPNTDYDSWDILTLTTVTMHVFRNCLSEDVVEEIKIIDTALKNYAQTAIESLDSTTFQFCCEDLVSSVKTLSNYVGGETKTNCKLLIEAYRQLDDADVDVDNYLNQMTLYASEIKTIPAIYKKTIADLKECASQMMEGGIDFEREKAMDMKLVVIGRNKEMENLAEEILETVWQSALERSESREEFSSVRLVVDKILEEIRKIPSVQTTKVARHCILLTITYSSWEALLEILKYIESRNLREHFENISRELEHYFGEMLVLSGNVTVESIQSVMKKFDEHTPRKDSCIQIAFSCFSVESMGKLFSLFKSDNSRHLFSSLDGALSECVGDEIHVHASTDMKGFCDLFDSQVLSIEQTSELANFLQLSMAEDPVQNEVLTSEGSSEVAIGYQPSEQDDPFEKVHSSEQTSEAASSFQPSEAEDPLQKEVPSIERTSEATNGLQPSKSNYLIRKDIFTSHLRKSYPQKRILGNSFIKLEYIQTEETEHAKETTNMEHEENYSNLKPNRATSRHIGQTVTDIDKPLKIGAEDLLKGVPYIYCGDVYLFCVWLLGKRWEHRYCIISQGCLYIYSDITSKKTKHAYSLKDFDSAQAAEPQEGKRFCIQLIFKNATTPLLFACDTDKRKEEWLEHFGSTIAHVHTQTYLSADSGFGSAESVPKHFGRPEQVEEAYEYVDEEIIQKPDIATKDSPKYSEKSNTLDSDTYYENAPTYSKAYEKTSIQATSGSSYLSVRGGAMSKVSEDTKNYLIENTRICMSTGIAVIHLLISFMKTQSQEELVRLPEGTFAVCVRDSSEMNGMVSLFKSHNHDAFYALEDLLSYYTKNPLQPSNSSVRLVRGYKS